MDNASKLTLLRLYRSWPERQSKSETDTEARDFLDWLRANCGNLPAVQQLESVATVSEFLDRYRSQAERTSGLPSNMRQEPRIEASISVYVSDGAHEKQVVGRGQTVDVGRHGLRIFAQRPVPDDASLNITVTLPGFPIRIYKLSGEPRWSTGTGDGHLVGVKLDESGDFERWQQAFDDRFGPASLASSRPSSR